MLFPLTQQHKGVCIPIKGFEWIERFGSYDKQIKWKFIRFFIQTCEYKVQMAQRISVVLNEMPSSSRDLLEFLFFCGVGFTAGSLGLI